VRISQTALTAIVCCMSRAIGTVGLNQTWTWPPGDALRSRYLLAMRNKLPNFVVETGAAGEE